MRKQLTGAQLTARLNHPAVFECENADEGGMDEGRYFVHLKQGYTYNLRNGIQHSQSCGNITEARANLRTVTTHDKAEMQRPGV